MNGKVFVIYANYGRWHKACGLNMAKATLNFTIKRCFSFVMRRDKRCWIKVSL
jgi:hypothetical protein